MSATALPTMSYAGSAFICANRASELSFWNAAASDPNAQKEGSTMQYLNEGSPLPICTLFPEFLLSFPVSGSAKMVYLEVLQRILMVRRADDHGNYFAVASIRELSEILLFLLRFVDSLPTTCHQGGSSHHHSKNQSRKSFHSMLFYGKSYRLT